LGMNVSRLRIPLLWPFKPGPFERDGFTLRMTLLRPQSRGQVGLHSADPMANPKMVAGYLDHPDDLRTLRLGFRQARALAQQPAFQNLIEAELLPGPTVQSDAELDAYIRQGITNVHHQVGTCRMGQGVDAVVDTQLRVHGKRSINHALA